MKKILLLVVPLFIGFFVFFLSGTQVPQVYGQLYPTSTPSTCSGTCRGTCLTSQHSVPGSCTPDTYNCCVANSPTPTIAQTCTGECRGTCLTSQFDVGIGQCSISTYHCCLAGTPTPTSSLGTCKSFCNSGEWACATCTGGMICCGVTPSPTGSTKACAFDEGCGTHNCDPLDTWIQNWTCPNVATTTCSNLNGCTKSSGGCMTLSYCAYGCHPSACSNTCGLGGCPSGCGSIDNCGGVDCASCPGGPTPTPTSGGGNTPTPGGPTNTPIPTATATLSPTPIAAPGFVRARAKIVSTTASTCAEVAASSTYLPQTIGIIPNVAPGYQAVEDGTYASWNVNQGTSTITYVPVGGYALKLACFTGVSPASSGTGMSAFVSSGQTVTWELGYSDGTPWMQAVEGDVYAASTMYSPIQVGAAPRYFSRDGSGGTPGIITYGANYDFDSDGASLGEAYSSSQGWLANESYPTTNYYAIMYHRFGSPTSADYSGPTTLSQSNTVLGAPANGSAYYVNGDLTIDTADWLIGANESKVFLVNGNLAINRKITITPGGFVAFIVNGNITVDSSVGVTFASSVPVVEGIYITSPGGTFTTSPSTTAAARRFVGKGTFVAGSFDLQRDLDPDTANDTTAAELFIYNPELLIHMPDAMKDQPISWEEVAP